MKQCLTGIRLSYINKYINKKYKQIFITQYRYVAVKLLKQGRTHCLRWSPCMCLHTCTKMAAVKRTDNTSTDKYVEELELSWE